jgi:hypothetical protein
MQLLQHAHRPLHNVTQWSRHLAASIAAAAAQQQLWQQHLLLELVVLGIGMQAGDYKVCTGCCYQLGCTHMLTLAANNSKQLLR